MGSEPSCIFCQIVAGRAPGHRIFEDERTLAFLDIFPVTRGHTLVVPKRHAVTLFEAPPEDLAAVALSARRVADAIAGILAPRGLSLHQLNGEAAGQTVFHLHTHVLPHYEPTSFTLHSRTPGDPEALAALAEQLRGRLAEGAP